ncbi:hypothetical protein AAFF_G00026800 [Aldrovandia affinis]|uniref:Uncharacterized protein n=1 Tax=Aldrovandia affinis TaxID=143900 RepID=A0AAD7S4T4_9TELE|nr:hypothetical protein AAFF_G00026800 [Aldrovandia affinis]
MLNPDVPPVIQFIPGKDNKVADLLSHSSSAPTPTSKLPPMEEDLVQLVHAPPDNSLPGAATRDSLRPISDYPQPLYPRWVAGPVVVSERWVAPVVCTRRIGGLSLLLPPPQPCCFTAAPFHPTQLLLGLPHRPHQPPPPLHKLPASAAHTQAGRGSAKLPGLLRVAVSQRTQTERYCIQAVHSFGSSVSDVNIGWPGRVHDARCLSSNSDLFLNAEEHRDGYLFPREKSKMVD